MGVNPIDDNAGIHGNSVPDLDVNCDDTSEYWRVSATTVISCGESALAGGESVAAVPLQLFAPVVGNTGADRVILSGVLSYLLFPLSGSCTTLALLVAECGSCAGAGFGLHRDNDRIVYWREIIWQ